MVAACGAKNRYGVVRVFPLTVKPVHGTRQIYIWYLPLGKSHTTVPHKRVHHVGCMRVGSACSVLLRNRVCACVCVWFTLYSLIILFVSKIMVVLVQTTQPSRPNRVKGTHTARTN